MKILILSQYFWPETFTINEMATSLANLGIDVQVLTGKPNYPEGKLYSGYRGLRFDNQVRLGVKIQRVPILVRGVKSPIRLALNYLSFIASASLFGPWLLRKYKADVIFVYAPSPLLQAIPALLLAKIKKVPIVLYVQDLWPDSLEATGYVNRRWILKLVSIIVEKIYKSVDAILIPARPFEASIRRLAPAAKICYLPNSVDNSFTQPSAGMQLDPPELRDGFIVMFAGNVGSAQAVHVIVDAAEKLANFEEIKFVVLGSGSELAWMQGQKKERKLPNLHLLGRFPVEAMPYMLSKASALLITLADRPIFAMTVPNKTQAYMAVGRPIIAALNGEGATLVAEAKAGVSVPAEDANALSEAVVQLYRMTDQERQELGANGRKYYQQQFEQGKVSRELLTHLQSAVRCEL